MDPAADEFVMHSSRRQPSRPNASTMNQDTSRSRCPALRGNNGHDAHASAMASPQRSPPYDPVHHGQHGGWWNPPYLQPQHSWQQQPSVASQPRYGGPLGDPLALQMGTAGYRPLYAGYTGSSDDMGHGSMPFYHGRHSSNYLPNIGGFEPSSNNSTSSRTQTSQASGNGLSSLPPLGSVPTSNISEIPLSLAYTSRANLPLPTFARVNTSPPPLEDTSDVSSVAGPPSRRSSTDQARSTESQASFASRWTPGSTYSPARSRRTQTRYNPHLSEPSSDEDPDIDNPELDNVEGDANPLLFFEAGVSADDRMRAQQLMRGQMSSRRVASGKALSSLEPVSIPDLPENEKTCVICYNEYGVQTPEGINEAPLRLPKCKHIFGDHCIKKWFEDNDTCPYCRDKVPSQPQFYYGNRQSMVNFIRSQHLHARTQIHDNNSGSLQALLRFRAGPAAVSDAYLNSPDPVFGRRAEGHRQSAWNGRPRSPPNDLYDSRRRTRARHANLRGSPPISRPTAYSTTNGSSGAPHAAGLPAVSRNHHTQGHRQSGGLPGLNQALNRSGVEHPPYLLEHLLRPPPGSTTGSPAPSSMFGTLMHSNIRHGSGYRSDPSPPQANTETPLSPTISGPEISMRASE